VNLIERYTYWRLARRFVGYRPQSVTTESIADWLAQFEQTDRVALLGVLRSVAYYSESETTKILVALNSRLLARLDADGIPPTSVVYVQVHDAGSSSPAVLNLLRDAGRLERKGCRFLDGRDTLGLHETTNQLGQGAIVYVDDFVATGNQFCTARDFAADYIVGNFAEFLLLPSICEEAIYELGKRGVEAVQAHIHTKQERPLHPQGGVLNDTTKARLVQLCDAIDEKGGLGYRGLATSVVFYRNAPNTVPLILRGSLRQDPWRGVLPRTTDLPPD
jgi:hypothetical protein